MKFALIGGVWDGESNSMIAESENGVFETTDEKLIEKLIKRGYKEYEEKAVEVKEVKKGETPMAKRIKK
jgi:hypothetical protein